MAQLLQEKLVFPQGVSASVEYGIVKVKGPKGEVVRKLFHPVVKISVAPDGLMFVAPAQTKSIKTILYTLFSHAKNMVDGVMNGFTYKLKICFVHFPTTVKVVGTEVIISNFLGEKIPRKANILVGVTVKVAGDSITVEGIDLEKVSQTAANIEMATRIVRRDRRRFQDGCYITEKAGVAI
ncbi:MAG: 50S ribosomal protein L6 [Nanoarchaeota archaeon]|nr:50S ribosomal protein L6 [Nanoarchaeota archaeon]